MTENETIRNRSFAEAYLRENAHEALIITIKYIRERYNLNDQQVRQVVEAAVLCAINPKQDNL